MSVLNTRGVGISGRFKRNWIVRPAGGLLITSVAVNDAQDPLNSTSARFPNNSELFWRVSRH